MAQELETNKLITCKECGKENIKILWTHLYNAHHITKEEYIEKHGPQYMGQIGYKGAHKATLEERANYDPLKSITEKLSFKEKEFYDKQFDILYKQAEMDPAVEGHIRDIVLGQIHSLRLNDALGKITEKMSRGKSTTADIESIKKLSDLIDKIQKQGLSLMQSLNLTREKKMAQKRSVETTPSRVVTSYAYAISVLTQEQKNIEFIDERDAINRLNSNLETLSKEASSDIDKELNVESDNSSPIIHH